VLTAEDDKLTPPKYGDFLVQNIKNAERVHIADAGHIAPLEKSNEVNAAITVFIGGLGF
jgi:pimeloyl-ACP methyl ester carboxylesterase